MIEDEIIRNAALIEIEVPAHKQAFLIRLVQITGNIRGYGDKHSVGLELIDRPAHKNICEHIASQACNHWPVMCIVFAEVRDSHGNGCLRRPGAG